MAWDLIFTLPNIDVPVPSPFVGDGVCLCSADDDRLQELAETPGNQTSRRMLDEFTTFRRVR
jgi:hypothetical protein